MLVAFDSMGVAMKPGDTMLDQDGERAVFVQPTRARTEGRSGKVLVRWVGDDTGRQMEYYDKVFELWVKDVPD